MPWPWRTSDATDRAEDALEELEARIFGEQWPMSAPCSRSCSTFVAACSCSAAPSYLREVVAALMRREVSWIDDTTATQLQDVYDHVLRAVDLLDGQRELMGNAVDAHLAIISNRMNQVMKKMTSWGAIILGSTLVAGIYGMNFTNMPELRWHYGYHYALALMATITLLGYTFFTKKDWL
ncbi:MAG: magnesium transporter CorA family protein [Acidimicrobiales bacterium]